MQNSAPATDQEDSPSAERRRALYEAVAIGCATFLVTSAAILGLWTTTSSMIRHDFGDRLTDLAVAAAQQVDPDLHRSLHDPAQITGPEYARAVAPLRRMRLALPNIRYIYTMVRTEDGVVHFVLDAAEPGDHDGDGIEDQSGLWEVYGDREPAMLAVLGDGVNPGHAAATTEPASDKWGTFMTGWAPLIDGAGRQYGILGVDVEASRYIGHLRKARVWSWLGLLPAMVLTLLFGVGFHRMRIGWMTARREARRTADALSAEQQRLASVVEGTNVGTWQATLDPQRSGNDLVTVDARWAAQLGRDASELNPIGQDRFFPLLVHPEDASRIRGAMEHAMREEGHVLAMDVRMRHAAGHWVWCEVRGRVIARDAEGRPLRMVGTQVDISARKAAELALQQSEANFRSLFELSPLPICQVEQPAGRFLMVNRAFIEATGYSREELLRMSYWDITPPEWHEAERREGQRFAREGSFGPYEKEYRRKDGRRYPVAVYGNHHVDPFGRTIGWAIVQDISSRRAMELALACDAKAGEA